VILTYFVYILSICCSWNNVEFYGYLTILLVCHNYSAMHVVLARYCYRMSSVRLSVCPSVCLSVRDVMYRGHIGWTACSLKLITGIISLGRRSSEPQRWQSSPRGTPLKFGRNRGGVVLSRKPAVSLKWGKIGPRLLLMTNRKSHTRFRLVPKSTTLDDLEGPLGTPFQNTCIFRSPPRKFE